MKRRKYALFLFIITMMLNTGAAETVTGLISSPNPEGFTLYTAEGPLTVTVTESTLWDTDGPLTEGDAAAVRLTEAEDGSLTAAVITCSWMRGQITEVNMTEDEEPFLMLQPQNGSGPIRVNLGGIPLRAAVPGITAEIWYSGIMTRSVPPQITALYMRGTVLQGVITKVLESGNLLLLTEDGETVLLCLSEDTLMMTEPEIGKAVRASVYPAVRLSLPPQYEAQDVFEAETAPENPIMTEEKQ